MQPPIPHKVKDQQLWLSPDRCIFWEEEKALILSDLHFGKTGHFRKSGIAVPQSVYQEDLHRLLSQVQYFQPRQVLIVGDLFHSKENKELALFRRWRDDLGDLSIRLIKGNHDILHDDWYHAAGISLTTGQWMSGPFSFIHDITEVEGGCPPHHYCFSGHIHPGVRISGMGKQSLYFPCFYFGETFAVLPAFSRFTGTATIRPSPDAQIFAIIPPTPGEKNFIPRRKSRVESEDSTTRDAASSHSVPNISSSGNGFPGPKKQSFGGTNPGTILQIQ